MEFFWREFFLAGFFHCIISRVFFLLTVSLMKYTRLLKKKLCFKETKEVISLLKDLSKGQLSIESNTTPVLELLKEIRSRKRGRCKVTINKKRYHLNNDDFVKFMYYFFEWNLWEHLVNHNTTFQMIQTKIPLLVRFLRTFPFLLFQGTNNE